MPLVALCSLGVREKSQIPSRDLVGFSWELPYLSGQVHAHSSLFFTFSHVMSALGVRNPVLLGNRVVAPKA